MIDNLHENHCHNQKYYRHQRSALLPFSIFINQNLPMSVPLFEVLVGEPKIKSSNKENDSVNFVESSGRRSNFGDILAYSFDFPKLYSQILSHDNTKCPHSSDFIFAREKTLLIKQVYRDRKPPESYICRLCHISGHWIDQCILFMPKDGFRVIIKKECILCGDSEHSAESCLNFLPIDKFQRQETKKFMIGYDRGKRTSSIITNTEFLNLAI
jgi:hypothetical protein